MKVAVTEVNVKDSFPKLMKSKHTGIIVLMFRDEIGTVINGEEAGWETGSSSVEFNMEHFEDFNGIVTLKNN